MFDLSKKVALVTGGSRGIGASICLKLAGQGAKVFVNFRTNQSEAEKVVAQIQSAGGQAEVCGFDVSNADEVSKAIGNVVKAENQIDILVNNAGIAKNQLMLRVGQNEIDASFSTNVYGALYCCKSALRYMMKARKGRVINLTSVVGEAGNAGQAVYSATKSSLIGFTKSLAREYASRQITVNAVSPGFIDTEMTREHVSSEDTIIGQIPLGRVGSPEDVANTVLFLASDEAAYVTGEVIRVNGGMYM